MTPARVYLDANVFIAAFETHGARSDHAWWILDAIEQGEFVGMTSELTLSEILVGPMQEGDDELGGRYQSIIAPGDGFDVAAVDRNVLVEAALLRASVRSLKLPDAIHLASARLGRCAYFVSDDRRIPMARGIQLVQLGPHALDVMRNNRS